MADGCCSTGSACSCSNIPEHKMCMMSSPANEFDIEKVIKLTSDPKFICRCCGRTANKKENLCNPVELSVE